MLEIGCIFSSQQVLPKVTIAVSKRPKKITLVSKNLGLLGQRTEDYNLPLVF